MLVLCSATSWYGMVVRSYQSFKLLKVESQSSPEYDTLVREALHFWVGFALISVFESYVEMFVSWFPLYSFCKLALLWYIILPQTKGSTVLFEHVIEPKFRAKVKRFELWLLEVLHTHVLTYTSTRDLMLDSDKVVAQTDEELDGLLLHAQEINQLVGREKLRRLSQSRLTAATMSTSSSSSNSMEEFVVITPPPPRPILPASPSRQVIQPSHFPARGYTTHHQVMMGEAVYVDDVAVAAVAMAVAVEEDEEITLADEALDLIDSPSSSSMTQRIADWLPSPGDWTGMLSFASATPVGKMRAPPPPPLEEEEVVVVVDDTPMQLRRSSRHVRAPSFDTESPQASSFTNRILTRRQAAANASRRH